MAKRKRTSRANAAVKKKHTSIRTVMPILSFPREILLMIAKSVGESSSDGKPPISDVHWNGLFAFRLTNKLFADVGAEAAMLLSLDGISNPFNELKFALRPSVLHRFHRIANHKYLSRAVRGINVCARTFDLIEMSQKDFEYDFADRYAREFMEPGTLHEMFDMDCLAGRLLQRKSALAKPDYNHYRSRLETQRHMLDGLRKSLPGNLVKAMEKLTEVTTLRFLRGNSDPDIDYPELMLNEEDCLAYYEPFDIIYKALGSAGHSVTVLQLKGVDPCFVNPLLLGSTSLGDKISMENLKCLEITFQLSLWERNSAGQAYLVDSIQIWISIIGAAVNLETLSLSHCDDAEMTTFEMGVLEDLNLEHLRVLNLEVSTLNGGSLIRMLERHAETLKELHIKIGDSPFPIYWTSNFPWLKRILRLERCSIVQTCSVEELLVLGQMVGEQLETTAVRVLYYGRQFRCDIGPYLVHNAVTAAN